RDGERAALVKSLVSVPDQFGAMRTPSLRHAGLGGPHFHEGQFETLEDVVRFYSTLEGAQLPGMVVHAGVNFSEQQHRQLCRTVLEILLLPLGCGQRGQAIRRGWSRQRR
ncbi:MAG: hypothetical protein RLZZ11_1913, partial [Cyanobacteriota bacterium]